VALSAGPRAVQQTLRVAPVAPPLVAPAEAAATQVQITPPVDVAHDSFVLTPPRVSVVGAASVDHQVGRTWNFHVGVHRDVAYVEAIPQPVFTNGVEVGSSGYLTPRVDFSLAIGHAYGDSSFTQGVASPFQAYNGNVRLRVALNRHWAVYSEGVYDSYRFEGNPPIPNGISPRLTRIGVRAGVMLWVPVMRRR
jgi:hypothetical protein